MMLSVLSNEDKICVAEQLLQQAKSKKPKHSADYYAGMWSDENFPPIDEMLDDLKVSWPITAMIDEPIIKAAIITA